MARFPAATRYTTGTTGFLLATLILPAQALPCAWSVAKVDVYDRSEQRALEVYRHRGREYVVGRPGNEYAIRIRNCSDRRVLAVVSVDGVNVVTGETAAPEQSGYVIEAGGYVNIQGWRKDLERTAAFYFSDPADAYASRTGRPDDLGVIGVALFRERGRPWHQFLLGDGASPGAVPQESAAGKAQSSRDAARSAPGPSASPEASAAEPGLGTGHGRREWSPAEHVEFERASDRPDQRVVFRYDRHENLVAMGVIPQPYRHRREPDPFPGALGFVPDP